MFFTPRYLKQAKQLIKGVVRFLNYHHDSMKEGTVDEIQNLLTRLKVAVKERNRSQVDALSAELNTVAKRSGVNITPSALAENAEVIFVSIVIAFAIRTYIAQPFQIPTSSMQPTLNGIIAQPLDEIPEQTLTTRAKALLTSTSWIDVVAEKDGILRRQQPVTEHKFLIFRPHSRIHFEDGSYIKVKSPAAKLVSDLGLAQRVNARAEFGDRYASADHVASSSLHTGGQRIKKGQILARGYVRSGDHVVVNKFAYHFRKPTRGEVFVFTTRNISYIENEGRFDPRWGSQHYIKRLTGLPGDTLDIQSPQLLINGQLAQEPGIRRVIDEAQEPTPSNTGLIYRGYSFTDKFRMKPFPFTTATGKTPEYFAMGDNSYFSLDSRYFGGVPQQNLVGPGWFSYWPLGEHWGRIR